MSGTRSLTLNCYIFSYSTKILVDWFYDNELNEIGFKKIYSFVLNDTKNFGETGV